MSTNTQSAETSTLQSPVEVSLLGFPEKLWNLVNNPKCKEVVWSEDGKCIVIPNTQQFICNVLDNPSKQIFKTKNFSSFIRQLNLYGFRKVTEYRGRNPENDGDTVSTKCRFKHPFFQTGRRDFLTKVKRKYESAKRGAEGPKLTAQPNAKNFLRESYESGGYLPWNPMLYPTAPFFPAFAPQMPMSPFQPAFQFQEMFHGGPKDLNTQMPCQWEYGPYPSAFPFSTLPLIREGNLKDTRETVDIQSRTLADTSELELSSRVGGTQTLLHNSPDSSVAHGNPSHMAGACPWRRVLPETKQPLPAQKSTAELTAAKRKILTLNNEEETTKGFDEATSTKVSEEEIHWKKRKLIDCEKCSGILVSEPVTSSSHLKVESSDVAMCNFF